MLKHPLACRLECGGVSLFQRQPLFLGHGQVLFSVVFVSLFVACAEPFSAAQEPSLSQVYGGAELETQLLLSFMRCMYLVLKGTSVSPYQQPDDLPLPTATGDGRSRRDQSPPLLFLVGAAAGCRCPRDGQSLLCRLEWRWHRPLALSLPCTLAG